MGSFCLVRSFSFMCWLSCTALLVDSGYHIGMLIIRWLFSEAIFSTVTNLSLSCNVFSVVFFL